MLNEPILLLELCKTNLIGSTIDLFVLIGQHHPDRISKFELRQKLGQAMKIQIEEPKDQRLRTIVDRSMARLEAIGLIEEIPFSYKFSTNPSERLYALTERGQNVWNSIIEFVTRFPSNVIDTVIVKPLFEQMVNV